MSDQHTIAGWLMVAGPALALLGVAQPSLLKIWGLPPESFVATVAAHRRAWMRLNGGFALASVSTTAGLAVLAVGPPANAASAGILACSAGYAAGAVLWCAVLAVRTLTTPLLADLEVDLARSESARLLGAALTALFGAFVALTAVSLAALGLVLLSSGNAPTAVAGVMLFTGLSAFAWLVRTGDVIPAVLYIPTALFGASLL